MKAAWIRQKCEALTVKNPKINPSELADRIGVPEGLMVASCCGAGTIRLKRELRDRESQLRELTRLGEVLSVSSNWAALLEVKGVYPKCQFF